MDKEQWPALPTQVGNALPPSTPVVSSVWNKGFTKPVKVDSPSPVAGKDNNLEPKTKPEADARVKAVVKETNTNTNTTSKTEEEDKDKNTFKPKPKAAKSVSNKERKNTKPKPDADVDADAVTKDKNAFQRKRGQKKNRKFVPLAVDEEVAEDEGSTKKAVPKKNNTKLGVRDAKVPKNRPPRSEGDGYYSGYYVRGRSGERVRVWVWVEA